MDKIYTIEDRDGISLTRKSISRLRYAFQLERKY
jgi:hypothetical protein